MLQSYLHNGLRYFFFCMCNSQAVFHYYHWVTVPLSTTYCFNLNKINYDSEKIIFKEILLLDRVKPSIEVKVRLIGSALAMTSH